MTQKRGYHGGYIQSPFAEAAREDDLQRFKFKDELREGIKVILKLNII